MDRLVLQEIKNRVFAEYRSKERTVIIAVLKIILVLCVLFPLFANMQDSVIAAVLCACFFSEDMLGKGVSKVIYMIPGAVAEYLQARLRWTMIIEIGVFFLAMLMRTAAGCILGWDEGDLFGVNSIFHFVSFITYIVIKNVWLLYKTHTYEPLYVEKSAQGIGVFLLFSINIIITIFENTTAVLCVKILILLAYGIYGLYICRFVRRNIMITLCRNLKEGTGDGA